MMKGNRANFFVDNLGWILVLLALLAVAFFILYKSGSGSNKALNIIRGLR